MINDRREVGGSVELHRLQALVVRFQNPLNTVAVGVVDVAVLGKTNTQRSSGKKLEFRLVALNTASLAAANCLLVDYYLIMC